VTLTTTIAAMLAAVKAAPDDDTPRLALADLLADTEPDEGGDADWAELIRVQCELARGIECVEKAAGLDSCDEWNSKRPPYRMMLWCKGCSKRIGLSGREHALLAEHEDRWRRGPACERCGGKGKIRVRLSSNRHWTRTDPARRRQNHASCPDCAGTGWTGPLGDREPGGDARYGGQAGGASRWRVPATFRRGFIAAVSTPLADVFQGDTVTPWAVRVARWPQVCLEEWGLTDREPHDWTREDGGREYVWTVRTENQIPVPGDIPHRAFHKLEGGRFNSDRWACRFPAPDVAQHALAKAVAQVVNEAARERG
jgi:uncharacterized protein (TIGR02996 family)